MNCRLTVLFVVFSFFVFSCNHNNDKYSLFGQELLFPHDMYFTTDVKDTIDLNLFNNMKIVTYIDSAQCFGCKMKQQTLGVFLSDLASSTNGAVPYVLIVHPNSLKEIRLIVERDRISSPICIDLNDDFNKTNKITTYDINSRSFLLDENNRVLLIGDPISNPKIKDLYIRTICERLGIERPKESVEPQRTTNSLGVFNWQTEQHTSFIVNNDKEETMHIDSLYTSCECTTASIDKVDIAPHEKARVSVTFKADKPEQFMREIYVDVRDGDQIVMVIEGEAIE